MRVLLDLNVILDAMLQMALKDGKPFPDIAVGRDLLQLHRPVEDFTSALPTRSEPVATPSRECYQGRSFAHRCCPVEHRRKGKARLEMHNGRRRPPPALRRRSRMSRPAKGAPPDSCRSLPGSVHATT